MDNAGFFSKDLILWQAWSGPNGNGWFWIIGLFGAALTSFYTYRLILLVFYGQQKHEVVYKPGPIVVIPLLTLCVLSVAGGYVDTPPDFGGVPALSNFLNSVLPPLNPVHIGPVTELITALCAGAVFLIGLVFAIAMYGPWRVVKPREDPLIHLWYTGWGVDFLYDKLFVTPFRFIVRALGPDFVDSIYNGIARLADITSSALRRSQNGRVRWYAAGIAAGFVVLCAVVLLVRLIPGL